LGGNRDRLLPVVLEQPVAGSTYSFEPLEYRHPIVAVFRGNEGAGLLQTFIAQYFRMKLVDAQQSKAQIALAFGPNNDPAIVTEQIHHGRVTVVGIPASFESVVTGSGDPWSVMPAMPSFQPIVQEILAWTLRGRSRGQNVLAGEPIGAQASLAAASTSITLATPDGRVEQVRVTDDADETRWSFGETWWSGIYEAESETGKANHSFVVNIDPSESDLAKVSLDELPDGITPLGQWHDADDATSPVLAARGAFHRPLLYFALALLFVESCLAWYLGYRAS
jgi:hypothetical protein